MSDIPELKNVPKVSFIDDVTLAQIRDQWIEDWQNKYYELTGEKRDLPLADPIRLVGYATALLIYQAYQYIDRAGKMDLLKYSCGDYLDNIAALKGLFRRQPIGAKTTLRFTISAVRTGATGIPGGIRAKDEKGNCFATDSYAEIPGGSTYIDVPATAITPGIACNGLPADSINLFVDPVPYIQSVTNIDETSGGDDLESDDDLTYRVLMHPTSYSVAGPKEAYEYWARTFRNDIDDVLVYTPAPTEVVIAFMLEDGMSPSQAVIDELETFLRDRAVRPLTDQVTVMAPVDVDYTIQLTYYINRSEASGADTIQVAVNKAIQEYNAWQRKIGRDINPSELIKRIIAAGAKRVEVYSPTFTRVQPIDGALTPQIPQYIDSGGIVYGGLEDD